MAPGRALPTVPETGARIGGKDRIAVWIGWRHLGTLIRHRQDALYRSPDDLFDLCHEGFCRCERTIKPPEEEGVADIAPAQRCESPFQRGRLVELDEKIDERDQLLLDGARQEIAGRQTKLRGLMRPEAEKDVRCADAGLFLMAQGGQKFVALDPMTDRIVGDVSSDVMQQPR